MRSIFALTAIAGVAGIASAQTANFTWSNDAPGPVAVGDVVTMTLALDFTPDPGFGFTSSLFDIVTDDDDNGYAGGINHDETMGLGRYFQFAGTFDGTTVGSDIMRADEFQLPQSFGGGDPTNPIANFYVFEFTVTDDRVRTVTYTSMHDNADVYQDGFGTSVPYDAVVAGTSFDIIPAPASIALLGLGLIRRRR